MSDLEKENNQLKLQLQSQSQGVEGLLAQLEAHKGMVNDLNQHILSIRTENVLLRKQIKTVSEQLQKMQSNVVPITTSQPESASN